MFLYIILYFVLFFASLNKGKNKLLFWLVIFIFSFLIGFRAFEVGSDTMTYAQMYYYINRNGYHGYPEWGYGSLFFLLGKLGLSFSMTQTIMTVIPFCLAGFVMQKKSSDIYFSLFCLYLMYFVFYAMNIHRQIIACFILLFAYSFLLENKYKKFVLGVFVASLFHAVSLCTLILLLKKWLPSKTQWILFILVFSFLVGAFIPTDVLQYFLGSYANYLQSDTLGSRSETRLILAILLSAYWLGLFIYIYLTSSVSFKHSLYCKIYFVTVVLNNLFMRQELGIRAVLLFSIFQILVFPKYIEDLKPSKKTPFKIGLIIYLSIFLFLFLFNNSAEVVPYRLNL